MQSDTFLTTLSAPQSQSQSQPQSQPQSPFSSIVHGTQEAVTGRQSDPLLLLHAAMLDRTRWAEVTSLLQRGWHMCPEDGPNHVYVVMHRVALNAYFGLWGGSLEARDDMLWVVPGGAKYWGDVHLERQAMFVGMTLMHMSTNPAFIGEDITPADVLDAMSTKVMEGGDDAMLDFMAPAVKNVGARDHRLTKAGEAAARSLRALGEMGFVSPAGGDSWRLRPSIRRFNEACLRAGGDVGRLSEALREAMEAARHSETGVDAGNGEDE